jgi:DNA invertase Pin-like site-specific DNA recombinase
MNRLARNLGDILHLAQSLAARGVAVEFLKKRIVFTGEDAPVAMLMLSVMGTVAEFERTLIRERQREGIALAKQRDLYRVRHRSLHPEQIEEVRSRVEAGEAKARIAGEFGISRQSLYRLLREYEPRH